MIWVSTLAGRMLPVFIAQKVVQYISLFVCFFNYVKQADEADICGILYAS